MLIAPEGHRTITRSQAVAFPTPTRIRGSCEDIRLCPLFFSRWMTRPARVHLDSRPDGITATASTDEHESNPMVPGGRVIAKDRRTAILVVDHQIEVAVVVEVADGQAVA